MFSDADMAGDIDGRWSTSNVLVFLGSAPIPWLLLKQKVVALSTCEVEYVAAATAACQSCVAAPAAGRADRRGSSPTSTNGGQPACHRPREEFGSARPEQTYRREVPLPQGLYQWRTDRHRVRRNWSATRGRPHQAARPSLTHGAEEDDRHGGDSRVSSRIISALLLHHILVLYGSVINR